MVKAPKPLPRVMSQKVAKGILEAAGWVQTLGGKHVIKMEKDGQRPITLPMHKGADYSKDLTSEILKQAGLK